MSPNDVNQMCKYLYFKMLESLKVCVQTMSFLSVWAETAIPNHRKKWLKKFCLLRYAAPVATASYIFSHSGQI